MQLFSSFPSQDFSIPPYSPEQPVDPVRKDGAFTPPFMAGLSNGVDFSHRLHAGENQIPCMYCHIHARRSPVAGIPSIQLCMGCHQIVAADKPEVQKIQKSWEEKKPIEWVKVYDLPDFVYFSHKRHIKKKFDCSECHGDVKNMHRIEKVSSLKMGWCMKCHEKNGASVDCVVCHK